ncbi:MAG: cytochrome c [Rhodomicrobium sp.]
MAESTEVEVGRQIAQRFCARCHAVGAQDTSANPDAPPLRVIAAKRDAAGLEQALGEGIIVGHPAMPQFQFSHEDVSSLTAYLKSLSNKG